MRAARGAVGPEALANAIVTGAVLGSVNERLHTVGTRALWLLEDDAALRADPADALSFAIDAHELWSAAETLRVHDALDALPWDEYDDDDPELERLWNRTISAMAKRMETAAHRRRLERLVGYLSARLPLEGYPRTSQALAEACEIFGRDRAVRARTAAYLLADTL